MEIQELIAEVLSFCHYEEMPKVVTSDGWLSYYLYTLEEWNNIPLAERKKRWQLNEVDKIMVCMNGIDWYSFSEPLEKLDYKILVSRLHEQLHFRINFAASEKEKKVYMDLHDNIIAIEVRLSQMLPDGETNEANEEYKDNFYQMVEAFIKNAKRLIGTLS